MADTLRYRAVQKIADGGSAEVFLAEQQGAAGFKRLVVLKRIRPELYADPQYREMLIEEAQLSMSLHHSNLVEVLDVGEASGRYFLVMELVDGWTLHQIMRRARDAGMPLPPELAVYIAGEICRALAYAHHRSEGGQPLGIVHRDVCPNNVLVSMHAEVKLTDFGIAKARTRTTHTKVGMIKGKPAYMSPEQVRAEVLDARSDLFSVGTVLYSLLTGKMPFPGPSDHDLLLQVTGMEVAAPITLRPELPKELNKLVLKAMAKKREDRFQSAQEMLSALEQVQRSALKPAGRSELENFLRTLSAKDGQTAITKQTMPPATNDEPEWIALSAEQAIVSDQTDTQRAVPHFAMPPPLPKGTSSRWPWAVVVLLLLGGGVTWWSLQPPAQQQAQLPPSPRGGEGRGEGLPVIDAGPTEDEFIAMPVVDAGLIAAVDEVDAGLAVVVDEVDAGLAAAAAVEEAPAVDAGVPQPVPTRISRSGTEGLKLTARLAPNQKFEKGMVAVLVESEPAGVVIKVDKRELGRTPATLHFKSGLTFDLWFEAKGKPPLRQWLMLTGREGKPPKVTLRDPAD